MRIRLLKDLDYGGAGTVPAGTELVVTGEYADGACWMALLSGVPVIVNKNDAQVVEESL